MMSQLHMLDFSVFYRALFGGTEGGRVKRQGRQNQETRVNRLLLGKYPEDISFGQISREVANKLIKGTINMTETYLPEPEPAEETEDLYTRYLPIFTANIRAMWSDLPDPGYSVRLLLPMLQAVGVAVDFPDVTDKEETSLFLGKALTLAVLNSRNILERKRMVASSWEAGVQDWETAVRLSDRRESQTVPAPAAKALSSAKPTGFSVFCGREQKLQELRNAFVLQNVVFLHGMGGIGKTALACSYWRTFHEEYTTVVFAPYENSLAALLADDSVFRFSGLCRREKEDGTLQTDEEYAREKLRLLRETQDEGTLIILDNYDIEDAPLFEELVRGARFHLLVTTQLEPETGDYCSVELTHIGDDEILKDLFLKYAGAVMLRRDDPDFPRLFDVIERHTLTLEVAAKHMAVMGISSLAKMVDMLENESYTCFSRSGGKDRYQKLRALLRISRLNEGEIMFLRCLALVPPAGIDLDTFRDWCGDCFPAMNRLARLSLIKQDPENRTLSLHSVLRRLILEELAPDYDNCRDFIHQVALVGEEFAAQMWEMPYEEKRKRLNCCRQILSRVPELCGENIPVFSNTAFMLSAVGDFTEGLALQERIYDFNCSRYGRESKPAMLALSEKARILGCMDDTRGSAKCYTEAADWFLTHPEEGDLDTCIVVQACARSWLKDYLHSGRPDSYDDYVGYNFYFFRYAESLLDRGGLPQDDLERIQERFDCAYSTLAHFNMTVGFEHECAADRMNDYDLMDQLDRLPSSASHVRQAYKSYIDGRFGMYMDTADAIEKLEESRELLLHYFGRREPRLVEVLETLYLCYTEIGDAERAAQALQEALEIARKILVPNHFTLLRLEDYEKKRTEQ